MSVLTKKERDGLEEVFLSIKNSDTIYEKIKYFCASFFEKAKKPTEKNTQTGYFRDILNIFFNFFYKVKKNLSK